MTSIFLSLGIGFIAGIIDIIPMILCKLDKRDIFSALVHWVVMGLVICHIRLPGLDPGWCQGLVLSMLAAVPVVIQVSKTDPKAVFPILAMSAVLGSGVGAVAGLLGF